LDIENLISQHEAVSEVAVVGVNDEKWGERPIAVMVPKPGREGGVAEKEIKAFLEKFVEDGVISKWAVPNRIYVVDEIPKTSVGKMDKKEIKKLLENS